jgi:hypothetical protein
LYGCAVFENPPFRAATDGNHETKNTEPKQQHMTTNEIPRVLSSLLSLAGRAKAAIEALAVVLA